MHRALVTTEELRGEGFALTGEDARHLQTVLRLGCGDRVELFDGHGALRTAEVTAAAKHSLTLKPVEAVREAPRHATSITLYACISKGKRMDWTIEKAVELGAERVVPVLSHFTVVKIPPEERPAKRERWARVAEDAARQCGSAWIPEVTEPMPFAEALELAKQAMPVFVGALTPEARPMREELARFSAPPKCAGWFVGPEGDFSSDELAALTAAGGIPVSLGELVLRAETACLYGLCTLNCHFL